MNFSPVELNMNEILSSESIENELNGVFAHRRNHPLLEKTDHDIEANENFQHTFQQETLANTWCSREVQFVAKCWRTQKVHEIPETQIVRIVDQRDNIFVWFVISSQINTIPFLFCGK